MREIAGKLVPVEFRPGEMICRENEAEDSVIILYEGKVNILSSSCKMKKKTLQRKVSNRIA